MKLRKITGKKGSFVGLFVFMILAFILLLVIGIWVYIGNQTRTQLHNTLDDMEILNLNGNNATQVINETYDQFPSSLNVLRWTTVLIFVAMMLSIWFGSYLVQTKPVFYIPYIFIVIIAVIVSVPISNTYEDLLSNATLGSSFSQFPMPNFIMLYLPMWIAIIGIIGGVIMFSQIGKKQEAISYYG